MRTIHPALAAHLAGGATTLARCWTLTRRDGAVLGFTDHDRDLVIGGVTHQAGAALEASELASDEGFGAGTADVTGVLRSAGLTEADIAAGLYDAARVEASIVDWRNPSARHLIDVFEIGEIRRGPEGFVAELRGLSHRFDEEKGRIYAARCDAELGDARCKASAPAFDAQVAWTDGRSGLRLANLGWASAGTYSGGRIVFLSGANAGFEVEARDHAPVGADAAVTIWIDAPRPIAAGDVVRVTPGCDKSFATCRDRFANAANFRGFPHIPGNNFLLQTAGEGLSQRFDGGSLFR